MENPRLESPKLIEARRTMGQWIRTHRNYSIGNDQAQGQWCLFDRNDSDEHRPPLDCEPFIKDNLDDEARALLALLQRHS